MKFLSLFAGIGGLDLGLERAGMQCVGQVEIDPFCRKVLAKHWPNVWRHDDVRTLTGELVRQHCGRVDLICGGFPCQDISQSGRKVGIGGERSGLWNEYARLIRELRPDGAVMENVAALLARGIDRVLGDLADIGYDAEWQCLPSAAVGGPTRRPRVFIIAYPHGGRFSRNAEWDGQHPVCFGWGDVLRLDVAERSAQEAASRIRGMDTGLPDGVDRLRALGNAVDPRVSEWIGRRIMEAVHIPNSSAANTY